MGEPGPKVQDILLIEDDAEATELVRSLLPPDTHIETVTTLKLGLDAVTTRHFDVVLVDLTLPDAFGYDAVVGLLDARPGLAILVLTGSMEEDVAKHCVALGAQDFLHKDDLDQISLNAKITASFMRIRGDVHRRAIMTPPPPAGPPPAGPPTDDEMAAFRRDAYSGALTAYCDAPNPEAPEITSRIDALASALIVAEAGYAELHRLHLAAAGVVPAERAGAARQFLLELCGRCLDGWRARALAG